MSEDQAIRLVGSAHLPWGTSSRKAVIVINTWDSPAQIAKCCQCCMAQCEDCVGKRMEEEEAKRKRTQKGGRGNKRNIIYFTELVNGGATRKEVCQILGISKATYFNMLADMRKQ